MVYSVAVVADAVEEVEADIVAVGVVVGKPVVEEVVETVAVVAAAVEETPVVGIVEVEVVDIAVAQEPVGSPVVLLVPLLLLQIAEMVGLADAALEEQDGFRQGRRAGQQSP